MDNYCFYSRLLLRMPAFSYNLLKTEKFEDIIQSEYFKSALFIATPSLFYQIKKKDFIIGKLKPNELRSLRKYLNRMMYRSTPFGLFSSVSIANWGTDTQGMTFDKTNKKAHFNLNFASQLKLAEKIIKKKESEWSKNPFLYEIEKEFRFIKKLKRKDSSKYEYQIESFSTNYFLYELLNFCSTKKNTQEIIHYITEKAECNTFEAENYFDLLTRSQILINYLSPNITGNPYINHVLANAKTKDYYSSIKIETILSQFKDKKTLSSDLLIKINQKLDSHLEECFGDQVANKLQADLEQVQLKGKLTEKYQEIIIDGLSVLNKIAPTQYNKGIEQFILDFKEKFDKQDVPILIALDPELGVDYDRLTVMSQSSDLLKNITFNKPKNDENTTDWSQAHITLMSRWLKGAKNEERPVIALDELDIKSLDNNSHRNTLSSVISVIFKIVDDQVLFESAGGASPVSLLGRFTTDISEINSLTKEIVNQLERENPNIIYAEIVHLSDEHVDNVNRRNHTWKYEIPISGQSVLNEEMQIVLSDLYVCVIEDKIFLKSKKHQKYVLPKLSSAFNYARDSLTIFRFLCDLQVQGLQTNLQLDLEHYFPGFNFYPRVTYKKAILSKAKWKIAFDDISKITSDAQSKLKHFIDFAALIKLTPYFSLTKHDQQLIFNLKDNEDILLFLDCIKDMNEFTICEHIKEEDEENSIVKDREGNPYSNQFIAFLHKENLVESMPNYTFRDPVPSNMRLFLPGSEWLYIKLFCHPATSNSLLSRIVSNVFIKNIIEKDKWFFIRYNSPSYHIRLRIRLTEENRSSVVNELNSIFSSTVYNGAIKEYHFDVYRREIERYGVGKIELVENFFCASSNIAINFLQHKIEPNCTWYNSLAFRSVSDILEWSFPQYQEREAFLEMVYSSLFKEYDNETLKIQMDQKYREIKVLLNEALISTNFYNTLGLGRDFENLSKVTYDLISTFTEEDEKYLKQTLIADIIHMHLNRLFLSDPRQQELILYYCLLKYQQSNIARNRKKLSNIG